jgi:hypothetical protein
MRRWRLGRTGLFRVRPRAGDVHRDVACRRGGLAAARHRPDPAPKHPPPTKCWLAKRIVWFAELFGRLPVHPMWQLPRLTGSGTLFGRRAPRKLNSARFDPHGAGEGFRLVQLE